MASKKDFTKSITFTLFWIRLSGININALKTKNLLDYIGKNWLFYFNNVWLHTDLSAELFYVIVGVQVGKDMIALSPVAPCVGESFLSVVKSFYLFINRDTLKTVLDKLKDIHPDDSDVEDRPDETERKIVKDSIKLIYFTIICLGISYGIVMLCFFAAPVAIMVHSYHTTGEYEFTLPFLLKYFFDVNTKERWLMVYLHNVWSTFIVCANVYGTDTLLIILCAYIKMHFDLISYRFTYVINSHSLDDTRKNIKRLIMRHQELLRLVEQMQVLFSKSTLIHFVISSALICFCLFTATFANDMADTITFSVFLVQTLVQILMQCYFGDILISASTKFSVSVFSCAWYNMDHTIMKDILFIYKRSQKPSKISALGYTDLELTTFTSVLSTSWSYFALLRTMYD